MVSGYLTFTNFPRVDGLSTDPWDLGHHSFHFIDVWFVIILSMFGLSSFYRRLVCHRFIDVVLFVVLLQRFICVGAIQTTKIDLTSRRYQIIVINMLKNLNCKYSSHYFIKFVGFMPIYYAINLDIVSSCMIFSYSYFGSIDILQV